MGQLTVFWATFAVTGATSPPMEEGRAALDRLILVADFYHHGLRGEVRALEGSVNAFYDSVSRYAEAFIDGIATTDLFRITVNDPAVTVRAARRALVEAAARLATTYV